MRKFLVLIVSVALLGACKSGGGDDNKTAAPSGGGIRDKVLTVADLPPNFKRTSLDVDKRDTDPLGCAALDQVDAQYLQTTEHTIDAEFQNGDDNATQFISESVPTFKTPEEAKTYFDGEAAGFSACKTFSSTNADGTTSGQFQPYPFPAVGEQSSASTLTVNGPGGTYAGPVVMVRKGNAVMFVFSYHAGNQPGLTGADVEAIVRKGADKL